jgi:pimeloyl-ACP methyl ester carboxylesterase
MDFDASSPAYSGIAIPTLVIRGERGHPYVARSVEILSSAIPNASLVTVPGAGHSMVSTHAAEVAKLITNHVSNAEMLS